MTSYLSQFRETMAGKYPHAEIAEIAETPVEGAFRNNGNFCKPADAAYDEGEQTAPAAERDNRRTPQQTEEAAFTSAVARWLDANPASSRPGRCACCGQAEAGGAVVAPFGAAPYAWVHPKCWPAWFAGRQQQALAALADIGVLPPRARDADCPNGRRRPNQ